MSYTTIALEVSEGLAVLTLNRPEAANTIDLDMARGLMEATLTLSENSDVRTVLLRGAGSIFCAGGDLKSFSRQGENLPRHLTELTTYLHAAVSRLARMDAPVVAAVHGSAAGAGFSLACSADLVVAAESSRFVAAYGRVGLTPDGSLSWYLPRVVGLRRALELILTNRVLTAHEAFDWGIATRVVPDGELNDESFRLASELASGATRALGAAKRLLRGSLDGPLEAQMENETQALAEAARTADGTEGIIAFLEKRSPGFVGR